MLYLLCVRIEQNWEHTPSYERDSWNCNRIKNGWFCIWE